MKNIQYRAMNVSSLKTSKIVKDLSDNGISKDMYRINYFSSQKELVAEKSIVQKIKEIIG